jgi:hypothetical protein
MKKLLVSFAFLLIGCAHYQGRAQTRVGLEALWCKRTVITYSLGDGLSEQEKAFVATSADAWNTAAAGRPLLQRVYKLGDVDVSRNGNDWGTRLGVAPDGCIVHAHVEIGSGDLEPGVFVRATEHELGHALGLAESVWPGAIMYNGQEITPGEAAVATRSCCQQILHDEGRINYQGPDLLNR